MKRLKCMIFVLALLFAATMCYGNYITRLDNWYLSNSGFSAPTITDYIYFTPQVSPPTAVKGRMYCDDTSGNFYHSTDGATWSLIDVAGGTSLDGSYDLGNGITVDGTAVTLTVGAAVNNSALAIVHGEVTNNNDAFTIAHSGSGDAIQVTVAEADGVAMRLIGAASQTTSLSYYDASTSNWDGADDVGMVHINTDDPLIHTGASLLQVIQSGTPIASAEGFLARFVQSGTARTNATAVEIEVKATQPALAVNGITKINGQDAAGATLFQVAGVGASGNADAMLVSNTGSGHCLQITPGEADSGGINLTGLAASTVPMVILDGTTNDWDGADNKGQLTLLQDTAFANAGATQLMIHNTGTTVAAAEGFLARFVQDTGAAVTDAYAVDVEVTDTTGGIHCDGHSTFDKGLQTGSQGVTATADGLTTGLIPNGASFVTVTSDNADKVVVLPTWVVGNVILITVPANGCELETLAASNDTINGVDCDGTNQMAMAAGSIYHLVCVLDSKWIAYAWGNDGAAEATIVPDAD